MTHCDGFAAAAVARAIDVAAIGIDAEPDEQLPDDVLPLVTLPEERARLRDLNGHPPGLAWDRLLFCTKEAVYKAWFPLTGAWLGFEDASVDLQLQAVGRHRAERACGAFTARLLVPGPEIDGGRLTRFTGRWIGADGILAAAIALPRRTPELDRDPVPRSSS